MFVEILHSENTGFRLVNAALFNMLVQLDWQASLRLCHELVYVTPHKVQGVMKKADLFFKAKEPR